jgi:hypothetical protein
MKLPGSMKRKVKDQQEQIFEKMSVEGISLDEWEDLNEKYRVYSEMVKPSWKITPDTLVVVAGNLMGILLILNFEKMDIIRSKAISFVLKGRV